jgi:hypothetical protein
MARTQAVLEGVGGPLLCTSVHVPEVLAPDTEVPDAGQMLELYGGEPWEGEAHRCSGYQDGTG